MKTVAYVFVGNAMPYLWPEHILWDLSEVQHWSLYDWWIERQAIGKNEEEEEKKKYKNNKPRVHAKKKMQI